MLDKADMQYRKRHGITPFTEPSNEPYHAEKDDSLTANDLPCQPGCYLDNHRGHYIIRDMILLAKGYGFIISESDQFVLDMYDEYSSEESYPSQSVYELADEVLIWLNNGPNEGIDRPIKGQNSPPIIPENYAWDWNDGDFGLYKITED